MMSPMTSPTMLRQCSELVAVPWPGLARGRWLGRHGLARLTDHPSDEERWAARVYNDYVANCWFDPRFTASYASWDAHMASLGHIEYKGSYRAMYTNEDAFYDADPA